MPVAGRLNRAGIEAQAAYDLANFIQAESRPQRSFEHGALVPVGAGRIGVDEPQNRLVVRGPHQVAHEALGIEVPLAVVSGPTFATEVGLGLPTAMTVAATNADYADELAWRFSDDNFRAYTSTDMVGVEVGGAVKNVLAIATGLSDGLGFGANARVALITRGLAEMTRLGVAIGAQTDTFMGLSGMGDLVLTCTDNQSRNRRMGLALAAGKSVEETAREIGQVVEGVKAAAAVRKVAADLQVEMPICEQVTAVCHHGTTAAEGLRALMSRERKSELTGLE